MFYDWLLASFHRLAVFSLVAGPMRLFFGAKGVDYYLANWFFGRR
jgi:uncharacterized membrane protein